MVLINTRLIINTSGHNAHSDAPSVSKMVLLGLLLRYVTPILIATACLKKTCARKSVMIPNIILEKNVWKIVAGDPLNKCRAAIVLNAGSIIISKDRSLGMSP